MLAEFYLNSAVQWDIHVLFITQLPHLVSKTPVTYLCEITWCDCINGVSRPCGLAVLIHVAVLSVLVVLLFSFTGMSKGLG